MATRYIVPLWQTRVSDLVGYKTYYSFDELQTAHGSTEKLVYATVPDYLLDVNEWQVHGRPIAGPIHRHKHLDVADKPSWYVDMTNPTCGSMAEGRPREFVDWYLQHCDEHTGYYARDMLDEDRSLYETSPTVLPEIAARVYAREKRLKHDLEHGSWLTCVATMQQIVVDRDRLVYMDYVNTTPGTGGCGAGCQHITTPVPRWLRALTTYLELKPGAQMCLEWLAHYVHMPLVDDELPTAVEEIDNYLQHRRAADMLADTSVYSYPHVLSAAMYLIYIRKCMFRS